MADLRITGVSNNQLELQAPDGTRHYLEITPDLLKALKSREVSLPANSSPREIQLLVRLGATLEEVAEKTGADIDLVAKFAKPSIAELKHVVALARSIRLSLAGDRFAEPTLVEFGSVMDERLVNNGATDISWSAKRSSEGEWLVSIRFSTSQGDGVATWSFDPKQLFLAPENEAALQLSNGVPVSAVAKTVPIISEPEEIVVEEIQITERTVSLTVVPEITEVQAEEAEDLFEEPIASSTLRIVEELVDERAVVEEISVQEDSAETEALSDDEPLASTEGNTRPQATSGWAEVLFGSKDDEEEKN
ncbi:MAG: septation protein SepH [Rhodoluna sp.]